MRPFLYGAAGCLCAALLIVLCWTAYVDHRDVRALVDMVMRAQQEEQARHSGMNVNAPGSAATSVAPLPPLAQSTVPAKK